jgi:hypothetical protein
MNGYPVSKLRSFYITHSPGLSILIFFHIFLDFLPLSSFVLLTDYDNLFV